MKKFLGFAFGLILLASCNNIGQKSVDEKFVGLWKYVSSNLSRDEGMSSVIGTLKKVEGTNETYTFNCIVQFDILFVKKDENTLEGASNNNMLLKYDENSDQLLYELSDKTEYRFAKLK